MGEKVLCDLPLYRSALRYYEDLSADGTPVQEQREVDGKIRRLRHTVDAADRAIALLKPLEREVVSLLYLNGEKAPLDVCADCAIEKSTLYRYRSRALEKIGKAMVGVV